MIPLENASRLKSSEVNTSTAEAADLKLSLYRFIPTWESKGRAAVDAIMLRRERRK